MSIVAVYSMKGGVGKTASSVNISYMASLEKEPVLVCDLDPQGSTSFYYRVVPEISEGKKVLTKKSRHVDEYIKGTDFEYLDLLPADFSYRKLDIALHEKKDSKNRLKSKFESLKQHYNYIFLDCPPNLTLLTENIFHASDYVMVPVIPSTLSERTYEVLLNFFAKHDLNTNKIIPFFSMTRMRTNLHKETAEKMRDKYGNILRNCIPFLAEIEKMGDYRKPVIAKRPKGRAADHYRCLWDELKGRLN